MDVLSQIGKDGRIKTQIEDLDKTYNGDVYRDKRDGYGVEINRKGKGKNLTLENTLYEGNWKEDLYHGQGTLYYKLTNCFFRGQWVFNEKRIGLEILANGD